MLEFNLLKEGHGILYKRVTYWYKSVYFKLIFLVFLFSLCLFFSNKNKHYLKAAYIDMENIFHSAFQSEVSDTYTDLKVDNVKHDSEFLLKELYEYIDSTENNEIQEKKVIEEENIEPSSDILEDQPVKGDDTLELEEKEKKNKADKVIPVNKFEFKVIAGSCLYRSSADSIYNRLKKNGYPESVIKKSKINVAFYSVMLGDFYTLEDIDKIREKINKKIEIEVVEVSEKYVVKTPSRLSLKSVEKDLKFFESIGIEAKLLKSKEKKDGFVVVVKQFDSYEAAYMLKGKLKKKGIPTNILKDIFDM